MKSAILLAAIFFLGCVVVSHAQANKECKSTDECDNGLECQDSKCGCPPGQYDPQQVTSAPEGGKSTYKCKKIEDLKCTSDEECSKELANAQCQSDMCVCKRENDCNGASSIALFSVTTLAVLTVGIMKML